MPEPGAYTGFLERDMWDKEKLDPSADGWKVRRNDDRGEEKNAGNDAREEQPRGGPQRRGCPHGGGRVYVNAARMRRELGGLGVRMPSIIGFLRSVMPGAFRIYRPRKLLYEEADAALELVKRAYSLRSKNEAIAFLLWAAGILDVDPREVRRLEWDRGKK